MDKNRRPKEREVKLAWSYLKDIYEGIIRVDLHSQLTLPEQKDSYQIGVWALDNWVKDFRNRWDKLEEPTTLDELRLAWANELDEDLNSDIGLYLILEEYLSKIAAILNLSQEETKALFVETL